MFAYDFKFHLPMIKKLNVQISVVRKTRTTPIYKNLIKIFRKTIVWYLLQQDQFPSQNKVYAFQEFNTPRRVLRTSHLNPQCSCVLEYKYRCNNMLVKLWFRYLALYIWLFGLIAYFWVPLPIFDIFYTEKKWLSFLWRLFHNMNFYRYLSQILKG